jgi:LPS O-antigen subunit length determinant protein (WzzB/FepE family)
MQNNQQHTQNIQEDEIDLRELFKTLWTNKIFIVIFTTVITVLAIIYALLKTPIYEVNAIFKIGEYKLNTSANTYSIVSIASASELTKVLEVLYIALLKNTKDRDAKVEKIQLVKGQNNLFEITAQGISNEAATKEIQVISDFVQDKHLKILDDVKELRESQIKESENRLVILKTQTLPALKDKIARYNKDIVFYENNFKDTQENLKKIKSSNPTLATIQINEQKYLAEMLMKMRDSLESFEADKNNIEMIQISKIEEELATLNSLMRPHNYKNTEIIGDIMTNDYAVKPKKKLIVVVAFVTGFILSIFLVFFMQFIRGFKEEEKVETV